MTDAQAHVELRLVAEPRYLCVARAAVETFATRLGLTAEDARRTVLAVDEALTNVIRHGYGGACDQPIFLRMWPADAGDRAGLRIVIEDECTCVDIDRIKGRPLDEIRPGGLGVHIIKEVMDRVEYTPREQGRGLRLTMIKFATPIEAGAKERTCDGH